LKFDRTGKYFITGSDDQVAKVFRLGVGAKSCRRERSSLNYGVNLRGAILVCSLRGHAGVVADIDVNSDNSFLATASGDGDIRVWGLKDGWPVAILRGHTGGANMVSWSTLNPFRLVSCGEDGMARMWDVHEAALKRYGEKLPSSDQTNETDHREGNVQPSLQQNLLQAIIQQGHHDVIDEDANIINNNIPGVEFGRSFGDFVVNSHIDEGVELTAQLQHGPTLDEINGLTGPVTRTGNVGPIKVMCIARCPVGGHFATGSSDGLGRVWADDDDYRSESDLHDDMTLLSSNLTQFNTTLKSRRSATRLLATLRDVHTHAVTDMKYSSAGDRIMTASMKDGNVCIWSGFHTAHLPATFCISSQLVIQLSDASRDGSHTVKVNCDGVAWTCNDMKVITSQSTPIKASGTEIIPESHLIYVWDSHSGKCLLGITSSHNALCPSLAPHPHLPSVFASTGADGAVNVWDLDRGDCFYSHANILLHGPIEPATDRGKQSGCLEAQFSPDGLSLILTDERGRVIILDTQVPAWLRKRVNNLDEIELREQYFANDYYELAYDDNGYCIERGSGKPPHLAPGGVRCNHEGVPYNEVVRETYKEVKGPLPISPKLHRDDNRNRSNQNPLEAGVKIRRITVRVPDFTQRSDTPIIDRAGNFVQPDRNHMSTKRVSVAVNNRRTNSASTARQLSNRYQWREDLPESEDDEEDQNDEDFEEAGRRLVDSSEDERDVFSSQSRRRQESGRGRGGSERSRRGESQDDDEPARASSRHSSQRTYNEYEYSDDDALEELMSTHTRPSGTYVDDWNVAGHLFKLPRGGGSHIRRNWLTRTIYQRRKRYCPQVGDTVVYIPRAHYDTIQKFWVQGYVPPWKSWPTATSWSVVRCKVTHARYRFPYEMCYKARSRYEKLEGVSVILTLEITGVPSKSSNRTFPWPVPTFVPPPAIRTRSCDSIEFEVTLFECGEEDYLVPEYLYSWRLKQLERAIRANGGRVEGLSVTALCAPEHDETEDADLVEYTGRLVRISETRDDEEFHLFDSGYNALQLTWDGENIPYVFSVWNISVSNPSRTAPVSPTIGDRVTFDVRKALSAIKKLDPKVDEWFCELVDTSKYTDYLEMIEVPMYVSLIAMRLRSNYYTNKLSVVADMELIKENSYKYNEDGNDIYDLACLMYDEFKSRVDAIEEDHTISAEEHTTDAENDDPEFNELDNFPPIQPILSRSRVSDQTAGSSSHAEDSDEGQVASRRRTRRSASQKSQLTVTGSHGQRASARARKKSSYKDDDSEEDNHSGSNDGSEEDMSEVEEVSQKKRKLRVRVTKLPSYEEKNSDEDDQEDESRTSTAVKKCQSRRPPPRARSKPVHAEEDSEENIENEQRVSRRPTRRSLAQESQLASVGSPGQRTSLRARKKATYKDKDSDEEESGSPESVEELPSDEEVSSDEEEHPVAPRRPTRRAATQKMQLSEAGSFGRLRSPRAARKKPSYQDISSSGGDESDESDDEKRPPPRGRRKPAYTVDDSEEEVAHDDETDADEDSSEEEVDQRKRKNMSSRVAKPAKKRSRTCVMNAEFPNLEKWQPVSRRLLNRVGLAVLAKLVSPLCPSCLSQWIVYNFSHHLFFLSHPQQRELDTLELFSRPVCEAYPIIAEAYLSVVETPMDFQTIQEERLSKYEHISELQDDIILTFRNCCVYNGEVSLQKKYYKYSL
jgi:WD40 repeat protein